jgi:hypothetical protein
VAEERRGGDGEKKASACVWACVKLRWPQKPSASLRGSRNCVRYECLPRVDTMPNGPRGAGEKEGVREGSGFSN